VLGGIDPGCHQRIAAIGAVGIAYLLTNQRMLTIVGIVATELHLASPLAMNAGRPGEPTDDASALRDAWLSSTRSHRLQLRVPNWIA
jgi:hypothetical protein